MKLRLLAVAAFAVIVTTAPARAADADPLWPEKSQQVMRLNIKQILESDIVKKYALGQIKQALEGKKAKELLEELNIDPLKDIDSVSMGMWKEDPKNPRDAHGLVVLRGKFDAKKLFDAAEKQVEKHGDKMSIEKAGDVKLIKVEVDQMPDPVYVTMANEKTILVGTDKKMVLDSIKVADDKDAKPQIKEELASLVKAMDSKASFIGCGLSSGEGMEFPPNLPIPNADKIAEQLKNLSSSSTTIRVTGDISLEIIMHMKSKDSADDLGASVKELLDLGRNMLPLVAGNVPQAKAIVEDVKKTLKSSVDEKNIKLGMKITGDSIGKAVGAED